MSELIVIRNPKSTIAESYRSIRTNIQFANVDKEVKTILVTSAVPEEGKTTTLANLAITMAQNNQKILVVDCDMRKPRIHKTFRGLSNRRGLSNLLMEQNDFHTYIQKIDVQNMIKSLEEEAKKSKSKNKKAVQEPIVLHDTAGAEHVIDVITAGTIPDNPSELLNSKAMKQLVDLFKDEYDYILFDTSPVIPVTDAVVMASYLDGVILVVTAGQASVEVIRRAKESLRMVEANILGVVLNKISIKDKKAYNSYYYYQSKKYEE